MKDLKELNIRELSIEEICKTIGGCKEWLLLLGPLGFVAYVGYHDASGGKHDEQYDTL